MADSKGDETFTPFLFDDFFVLRLEQSGMFLRRFHVSAREVSELSVCSLLSQLNTSKL